MTPHFWVCALTECPSLSERGPYTRIHFIFDCPPGCTARNNTYKKISIEIFKKSYSADRTLHRGHPMGNKNSANKERQIVILLIFDLDK